MEQTPPTATPIKARAFLNALEPSDISFLIGLALIYLGTWMQFSAAVANITAGVILVATPLAFILNGQKKA